MNKDIHRENQPTVSSKYFTTKSGMDESLSDFQEPKKLSGPKASMNKAKPERLKKAPKRIRGQKDIRSALKTKKNELKKYAEDFDKVCKHAGLDVDSEQLQLAIALSKSLQESSKTDTPETSQSHTTQERVGKIRTTLLEYGFKVPEIKKPFTNKRLKKKKSYKLLTTSEEAKKQIISDKYSQVLIKNITVSKKGETGIQQTNSWLYYLATSASYCGILNDINTFYVENLLEKSTSTCNLLRDWSEIPGRPLSPKLQESIGMNFSEIDCSQDELDIVLSGSLKCSKSVIQCKGGENRISTDNCKKDTAAKDHLDNSVIIIDEEIPKLRATSTLVAKECDIEHKVILAKSNKRAISLEEPDLVVDQYRSCSPDIFDDEPSVIENTITQTQDKKLQTQENVTTHISTNNDIMNLTESGTELKSYYFTNHINSQSSQNYNTTKICNDLMEMTECVEIQRVNTFPIYRNVTNRKSNDFMDITNCVAGPVTQKSICLDIDLTQSPTDLNKKENETIQDDAHIDNLFEIKSNSNQNIDKSDNKNIKQTSNNEISNIDLTESPKLVESNETFQGKHIDTHQTFDKTSNKKKGKTLNIEKINIDLTECPQTLKHKRDCVNDSVESLDLTQSSNTSDELPFVSLKGANNNSQDSIETIMDPKDYEYPNEFIAQDDFLDLTQNLNENLDNSACNSKKDYQGKSCDVVTTDIYHQQVVANSAQVQTPRKNSKNTEVNISFFDEYIHDHSGNNDSPDKTADYKDTSKEIPIFDPQSLNVQSKEKDNLSDDIDLTQNSDTSESYLPVKNNDICKEVNQSMESEVYGDVTIEMEICKDPQSDIVITQNYESDELSQDSLKSIETELNSKTSVEEDVEKNQDIIEDDTLIKSSQRYSSLGKKDNISIDYDEVYNDLAHSSSRRSRNLSKSATDNLSNVSNKIKDTSNSSQHSDVFVISDNELDYSMHKSKLEKPVENFMLGGISIMDEFSRVSSFRRSINIGNDSAAANINKTSDIIDIVDYNEPENIRTPIKHKRVCELASPQKPSCSGINTVVTPSNNEYIIKTNDVTPMPKYESMSLEDLHAELDKFGVKPFKRKRAIQLLMHIYNETHPILESNSDEESPCKRRKIDNHESPRKNTRKKLTPRKILSPKKIAKSMKTSANKKFPRKVTEQTGKEKAKMINDRSERLNNLEVIQCTNNYEVNETPFIKEVHCSPEDWVFQKREKAKVHSCRVPLHIAFHNYVSSRHWLKEAILCYEPVNIDDIHKDLVSYGHRYDPKDLLKFMDKKCITVKTSDNDGRNNKIN